MVFVKPLFTSTTGCHPISEKKKERGEKGGRKEGREEVGGLEIEV
jgi:hypothetical protein